MVAASLREHKIVHVFLEATDIARERSLLEQGIGLKVIENRFHPPHHRHGIVKYDAGTTIIALNLATKEFDRRLSDGVNTVFSAADPQGLRDQLRDHGVPTDGTDDCLFVDDDNHAFSVRGPTAAMPIGRQIEVAELELEVDELAESLRFYTRCLGFAGRREGGSSATIQTGNIGLRLLRRPAGRLSRGLRLNGYLIVIHVADIRAAFEGLLERGLEFRRLPRFSDIGGTVRFRDPTGHQFCLYEPSAEAMTWESGAKVREIATPGPT
jgi:predicted enzyme related to lactoylglutathione lyase